MSRPWMKTWAWVSVMTIVGVCLVVFDAKCDAVGPPQTTPS